MPAPNIALQVYTVRDLMTGPEQIADTLEKVAAAGYGNVEAAGLYGMSATDFRAACEAAGLTIVASHASWEDLRDRTDEQIQWLGELGATLVATGSPREYQSGEGYARFARETTEFAAKLAEAGITYMYHNHAHEYARFDGCTGMQIMAEQSDPELFKFELDVHWVSRGGACPVAWLELLAGRVPVLHCKDTGVTPDSQPLYEPVGAGNLDWPTIMAMAAEVGVEHYIVEQDICQLDVFESIAISYANLEQWLSGCGCCCGCGG